MTFVRLYLVGYFILVFGALFALWQSGALAQIPREWVALAAFIAIGLGILLALVSHSGKITATRH